MAPQLQGLDEAAAQRVAAAVHALGMGRGDQAEAQLRPALAAHPDHPEVLRLHAGILSQRGRNDEAIDALRRAVELAPDNMDARAQLADLLRMHGDAAASASEYREIVTRQPTAGGAWWGLADLRAGALGAADIQRMCEVFYSENVTDDDRVAIGFALAKALDEVGRYDESLDALNRANAIARRRQHWNASAFAKSIDAVHQAFTPTPAGAATPTLGQEVLFIVGMPRSGTTLVEQILASHSRVEGAGELTDLTLELGAESRRHGQPFPRWVPAMRRGDWQRLGERYLDRTAHWRSKCPMFTDKLPVNWMYMGAIRAMLPGAHIVVCRRDPLETCFSCYRQYLAGNEYARTPADLAAFWRAFDRTATHFAQLHPKHVYQHDYEALVASPEQRIRKLLDACQLPFEEACLRFYETRRDVRSPSATQVRQPLRRGTARARDYGSLLDPLRACLGLAPFET